MAREGICAKEIDMQIKRKLHTTQHTGHGRGKAKRKKK